MFVYVMWPLTSDYLVGGHNRFWGRVAVGTRWEHRLPARPVPATAGVAMASGRQRDGLHRDPQEQER